MLHVKNSIQHFYVIWNDKMEVHHCMRKNLIWFLFILIFWMETWILEAKSTMMLPLDQVRNKSIE